MTQISKQSVLHRQERVEADPDTPEVEIGTVKPRRRVEVRSVRWVLAGITLFAAGLVAGRLPGWFQSRAGFATVDGVRITRSDFAHRCELAAGPTVIRQMVVEELQLQLAQQHGVLPSVQDVEARYRQQAAQAGFAANLAASHKTPDDVRRGILLDMAQTNLITKGVTTTDADAVAYYQANVNPKNPGARYYQPTAVQVAVIVSDRPDDIKAAVHDLASGAAFASVAARYSKDQSKANGGLLPPVRRGQVDAKRFPGLEGRLFGMHLNDQIDDVVVAGAHWIIRCVGRSEERLIPFEQVRTDCERAAKLQKGLQVNGASLKQDADAFEKAATIEVAEKSYLAAAQSH